MRAGELFKSVVSIAAVALALASPTAATDSSPALRLSDPSGSSPPLKGLDEVVVKLSEEEKTGKVTLTPKNGPWTIAIEAPIDKNTKRSDLIDLDGFSNAASFQAGVTKYFLGRQKSLLNRNYHENKLRVCEAYAASLTEAEKASLRDEVKKDENLKHLFEAGEPSFDVLVEARCEVDARDEALTIWDEATDFVAQELIDDPDLFEALEPRFSVPLLNFKGKLGVKDFSYVVRDASTDTGFSKKQTQREAPWSVEISIGQLRGGGRTESGRRLPDKIVWLTYQRSTSYKDAKAAEVCSELDGPDVLNCEDVAFGLPVEKKQELVIAELRSFIGRAGYSVKGFHDFEGSKSGARAELYFLRSNKGGLTGGVGVEWQEGEDVKGSLFLTKGFSIGPDA